MNEEIKLPSGITYNDVSHRKIEIDLLEEIIESITCAECQLIFNSTLITIGNRHSGTIKANDKIVWENLLPKNRVKSITILKENLIVKLNKHKERHIND
jgi:hypothetical protein